MENQQVNMTKEKQPTKFVDVVKKVKKAISVFFQEVFGYPLYILTHPMAGWQSFKQEKKGKMWVSIVIIVLYVAMKMLEYNFQGPVINTNNPQTFSSIRVLVYGALPPLLLSIANWSVTTLMDGKGKMKEIFMMACYSYFPVMILGFINIPLSNVITASEAQFIQLIQILAWTLTGFMALTGLISIHEYGLGKVLWSVILTIVATAIIVFLALLIFNLAEQIYGFLYSIYDEISTRYM